MCLSTSAFMFYGERKHETVQRFSAFSELQDTILTNFTLGKFTNI